MTRCVNCGLPLQPERNQANCPRCGSPLNAMQQEVPQQQFGQAGWSNMGGMPQQNPWGQTPAPQQNSWGQTPAPGPYNQYPQQNEGWQNGTGMSGFNGNGLAGFNNDMGAGLQQTPFTPQRPTPPTKKKTSPAMRVALVCFILSIVIVGFVGAVAIFNSNKGNSPTASSNTPQATATSTTAPSASPTTASASPTTTGTANASPTASGTAYPGQQYITSAQMVASDPSKTPNQQPATSFVVNTNMYVTFTVNPPSSGGAVCSQWYLGGNQVTTYPQAIRAGSKSSYTWATYQSPGQAYVQLYWASDKSCSDEVLAQQVNFTVTAS